MNKTTCSQPKDIQRPDEEALRRVMKRHEDFVVELVIRLAWQAGLNRREIHALTWDQISFEAEEIRLPDRTIPMHPELHLCLQIRRKRPSSYRTEYVVLTDARRNHPHEAAISKLVGDEMHKEEGLKDISLRNLREDYIIRVLQENGTADAACFGGISMATLRSQYCQFYPKYENSASQRLETTEDENALLRILAKEGTSPAGMVLWLVWKMGMALDEVAALTWDQVDFEKGSLAVGERKMIIPAVVYQLLKEIYDNRSPEEDPHVLLTTRSKRPFAVARLSAIIRTPLMQGGLGGLRVSALPRSNEAGILNENLLAYMQRQRFVKREDVVTALEISRKQANEAFRYAIKHNQITRIGVRYYLKGTVVEPEEHYRVICDIINKDGAAMLETINEHLGTEYKAGWWIVSSLVEQGKLIRKGRRYFLPKGCEEEKSPKGS